MQCTLLLLCMHGMEFRIISPRTIYKRHHDLDMKEAWCAVDTLCIIDRVCS